MEKSGCTREPAKMSQYFRNLETETETGISQNAAQKESDETGRTGGRRSTTKFSPLLKAATPETRHEPKNPPSQFPDTPSSA